MQQTEHEQRRILVDYEQLRREVSIAQVLSLVEFRPVSMSGSQLRGPCPVHKSSSEKAEASRSTPRETFTAAFGVIPKAINWISRKRCSVCPFTNQL